MKCLILSTLLAFIVHVHGTPVYGSSCVAGLCGVTVCDSGDCNQNCIAAGWTGGYCKDDQCWCWRYGQTGDRTDRSLSQLKSTRSVTSLEPFCDMVCTTLNAYWGVYIDGVCMCYSSKRKSSWALLHEIPTNFQDTAGRDVSSCTDEETCRDACKAQDAVNGFCLKNLCWCSMTNATSLTERKIRPVLELQSHLSGVVTTNDTCDSSNCARQCDYKQKTGGSACLHGYCWCK